MDTHVNNFLKKKIEKERDIATNKSSTEALEGTLNSLNFLERFLKMSLKEASS